MGALVLSTADPLAKTRLTHAAFSRWAAGLPVGEATAADHPARPDKLVVVPQKEITTHKEMGVPLNAYMLHNLAHVELNAIDLAWYSQRLAELGFSYGDMPVHNLLWRECAKSSSDVSARMAVIPLVQAMEEADVKTKWENSSWGKKLIVQKRRAALNDFDRFKVMLAKIKMGGAIRKELAKLKKASTA